MNRCRIDYRKSGATAGWGKPDAEAGTACQQAPGRVTGLPLSRPALACPSDIDGTFWARRSKGAGQRTTNLHRIRFTKYSTSDRMTLSKIEVIRGK